MRSTVIDQGLVVDEWKIYREVASEPAQGRVVGWGASIKGNGSPSQGGNKHQYTDLEKKKLKDLEKEVKKLKRIVKLMLRKSSAQESSPKGIAYVVYFILLIDYVNVLFYRMMKLREMIQKLK